ncbi:MAG: hydroxymethylglutaryl-CoA lyase [Bacteroidetes bacterium]|nr:hydroxymethylglutaryl-CoA lyase [Bacteroidota bacterium]MCB9227785.1 hydroxymethylglutaryl-CoA lyase [Chitinophagales bacterium]
MIHLVECPRDAMQGIKQFIPTELKAKYINALLKVGYHTIDFGSFVSPKAIPQMADTKEVLKLLDLSSTPSKLLAIVANERGAKDAAQFEEVSYIGYPFSISETFQLRNTNSTIEESFERVKNIQDICLRNNKTLVVYISMGFGNPYGDPYNKEIVVKWIEKLSKLDVKIISLSDTVGLAQASTIAYLFDNLEPTFPKIEFGAHLHTAPHNWREKIDTAFEHGCRRFDTAIFGYGGCPMAKDDLIGNMATEHFVNYFGVKTIGNNFNIEAFENAMRIAKEVF